MTILQYLNNVTSELLIEEARRQVDDDLTRYYRLNTSAEKFGTLALAAMAFFVTYIDKSPWYSIAVIPLLLSLIFGFMIIRAKDTFGRGIDPAVIYNPTYLNDEYYNHQEGIIADAILKTYQTKIESFQLIHKSRSNYHRWQIGLCVIGIALFIIVYAAANLPCLWRCIIF